MSAFNPTRYRPSHLRRASDRSRSRSLPLAFVYARDLVYELDLDPGKIGRVFRFRKREESVLSICLCFGISQSNFSVVSVFEIVLPVFRCHVWFYFHAFQVWFLLSLMHDLVMWSHCSYGSFMSICSIMLIIWNLNLSGRFWAAPIDSNWGG